MAPPLVSKFEDLIYLLRLCNLFNLFLWHAQLIRLRMRTVSRRITTATFDPVGYLRVTIDNGLS